ncbi:hypothetical protein BCR33DRAFT_782809 [Rhizoclosmatium globosum]|uniref:RCC1/BLIP-II protein n=1 Tax=Rhizoclosmatium globosum TaxID=329046 RepID=A0A1Y2CL42_9FUNG|nr:hypothetical protein BCR33DRAFT_782809 [Rhizoclosmatium globosum]|eukprot:ORY47720.1 hypothetical protein BCR33DRAFT_782809 [Rhizoclosmatium globosum]
MWADLKAIDFIQMPDLSFVVAGTDLLLYTCSTLSVAGLCTRVSGSGYVKSIDVLGDKNTFIGVGTDNMLYTRGGIDGKWVQVVDPGTVRVVDITVLISGVLSEQELIANSIQKRTFWPHGFDSKVSLRIAYFQLADGSILFSVLEWTMLCMAHLDFSSMDPTLERQGSRFSSIARSVFVAVGMDRLLYTCTISFVCTVVPSSGFVSSIALLGDKKTLLGVGDDNQLYTRAGAFGSWVHIPGSGSVFDVTVLANGVILGVGMDKALYTRDTLTAGWVLVPNTCCVLHTAQLADGSIIGVGPDNLIYQKQTLNANWELIYGSGSVVSVASVLIQ